MSMKKFLAAGLALVILAGCSSLGGSSPNTEGGEVMANPQFAKAKGPTAVIKTTLGDITVQLYPDEAPKTVENFITHAKNGYYDGIIFHRVINNFMVQGGDPTGTGRGGESIWGESFTDEFSDNLHNFRGALSMANSGSNTNGSQFFIVQQKDVQEEALSALQEARDSNEGELGLTLHGEYFTFNDIFPDEVLDYYREQGGAAHLEYAFGSPYTIFGQVIDGMDVVDAIAAAETDSANKPLEEITIEKIVFENYTAE